MGAEYRLPELFASHHGVVQLELKKVIDSSPPALSNTLRYHMGWQNEHGALCNQKSGKFIRSTLCLLSCEAVGGETSRIVPAAAAIELIHNFSLIHDDIEDASYERHHRPTVWKLWGQAQAINAGDTMFTLAYLALLRLKEQGIPDNRLTNSVKMLSLACLELCEGQYLDIEYESRLDITIKDYLSMATKKTAALLGLANYLGAYLGSGDSELANLFYLFGKELGIAYQIRDDILGIWGTEGKTGKSAGDISQRKKTLPIVYGFQNSNGEARRKLEGLYSQKSINGDDVVEVTKILDQLGAREYAENLAEQYYYKALTHLEASRLDPSREAPLKEAAHFLLNCEL